ncbi:DUF4097 domain-containing protein [Glaciecola sp. SC05]|uniref:DUF4097 family beta strand repeat-containing protein n=1 Tax=Glaciecola sp. SC05 TaxID=1987355 RepID=UPI003529CFBD
MVIFKTWVSVISMFSIMAFAGEKVDQTLDAAADSIVQIEHTAGSAEIIGWDKEMVSVSGELGDDTEEFIFKRNGKSIEIKIEVKQKKSWGAWNSSDVDGDKLVIYVPKGSRVEYNTTNADLRIDNILGSSDIEIVNGDIQASNLAGRIQLESVNGEINAKGIQGDVYAQAVNGDIKIEHVSGKLIQVGSVNGDIRVTTKAEDIAVETVNGDIEFEMAQVASVDAQTVNGDIDLSMALRSGAVVKANSVGGKITLSLPVDTAAKFDLEAHAGGSIRNTLSDDKAQEAKYGPREWLEFTTGEPNATVDVTTVHGRIVIAKK